MTARSISPSRARQASPARSSPGAQAGEPGQPGQEVRIHLALVQPPPMEQAPLEPLQAVAERPWRDLLDALDADPAHGPLTYQHAARRVFEAALVELDRQAIAIEAQAGPAYEQFNAWLDTHWDELNNPDNQDIPVPAHINGPYLDATQAVRRILHERAALAADWERAGIEEEMPQHGLRPDSLLARLVDEAQAQRAHLRGALTQLQMTARNVHDELQRLPVLVDAGFDAAAHRTQVRLESAFVRIAWSRYILLGQWDAAGLGAEVPHHGLTPEDGLHFLEFEAMDVARLNFQAT
jgi:hypothetical protein